MKEGKLTEEIEDETTQRYVFYILHVWPFE